ncbi:non-ribosomal peptide synthetase [Streptomyces sp. NBC_01217]|uniref:non-ribosomal peptide synthetase n=1 Tax=Streptomyces sp. NBC_01217 TaxID=2903779 RepID=UPI002E149BBD|nr:amino acid adenylation domain-containing protein [Streptomyces sp. NBC_01217]
MELTEDTFVVPASYAQRRLWFLEQMEGGGAAWNIQAVLRLRGTLDTGMLQTAVNAVVRRHEALRTTFAAEDGAPVQVVWPWSGVELRSVMCDDSIDPAAAADEWLSREWQRPFDIEAGPLFRAALLRLGEQEHRLALGLHHLIADGWSLQVLYQEVIENYRRLQSGEPALGEDLEIQYPDFSMWERENLTPETLETSMEVWRQRLKGAGDTVEIPADRRRTPDTVARGTMLLTTLPGDLVEDIRAFAAERGATVFMVLLAAFDTLLHRYTGQTDVMVGVPVANRAQPGLDELIGCFVNTLVVRGDLDGDPSFEELLTRVREVSLEAIEHQEVPLEWLVEELRPGRDRARQPFFQAVLHLAEVSLRTIRLDGLTVDVVRMDTQAPGVDLALTLVETETGLAAAWEYDAALFDGASIERMQAHFRTLLEAAVAEPALRLSELRMLGDAEHEELVAPGPAAVPDAPLLHEVFAGWARERPDGVAVVSGGRSLSFGEVDAWADRLAGVLRSAGVGPEVRVGVCLPRSVEWVVAVLGVLKSGGAYVPLDPEYPSARLEFMLSDSGAAVVVGAGEVAEGLGAVCGVPVVAPDAEGGVEGPGPVAGNLAYVIYTSGSTGRPKGVQITHASLAGVMAAQRAGLPLGPDDVMLQFCSPSFDASMFEIGLAVGAGSALVLGTRDELVPGAPLAALMRRHQVTAWTAPPSAIAATGAADVPSLRVVMAGGEVLTTGMVQHWTGQARCFNLYGPTEATIYATAHRVRASGGEASLPIGTAIPGYSALVLDAELRPVPANVVGELYLGGVGTARGYLGRPGLTAERFVPDPHSREPGSRLYRTGDLARRRADGELEFVGRADDQIKIRGFRVELGEIESVLTGHPGVRECAVVAREDSLGVVGLTACVVREASEAPVSAQELRVHLGSRLPEHFSPAGYLFLESLPFTSNGKADRAALTALLDESAERPRIGATEYEAPRTPLEEMIAGIWQEVLGVEQVGIHDDFFEKGGHSLLAAQVIARIRAATGVDVSVRMLFEHRVLSELTEAIMECALDREQPDGAR